MNFDHELHELATNIGTAIGAQLLRDLQSGAVVIVPEFLTPAQAAAFTGFTAKALEALRSTGKGPVYACPGGGRKVRYHVDDLRAWMRGEVQA